VDLIGVIAGSAEARALAEAMRAGQPAHARGAVGSSTHLLAGVLASKTERSVLLVVAHLDQADEALEELTSAGIDAVRLPALELVPGETRVSLDLFAERLSVLRQLSIPGGAGFQPAGSGGGAGFQPAPDSPAGPSSEAAGKMPAPRGSVDAGKMPAPRGSGDAGKMPAPREGARVIVAPIHALMQPVPPADALDRLSRAIRVGDTVDPGDLVRWLDEAGYRRADAVEEPGDFAVRGGIVDVFAPGAGGGIAARLDFFGDEVESIHEFDVESMGSGARLDSVDLPAADLELVHEDGGGVSFLEHVPHGTVAVLAEILELTEQGRGYFERAHEAGSVFGPPAVFKKVAERCRAAVQINQLTGGGEEGERVELPVSALPTLSRDAHEAVREVGRLAEELGATAVVCCQNGGELQRFEELRVEAEAPAECFGPVERYVHRGFIWGWADAGKMPAPQGSGNAGRMPALRGSGDAGRMPAPRVDGGGGFQPPSSGAQPLIILPYHELLHRYQLRRSARRVKAGRAMDTFLDFAPGDLVVHAEHGICRFVGLRALKEAKGKKGIAAPPPPGSPTRSKSASGKAPEQEYLVLEFSGKSRLNVPATQIDQVQRYVGGMGKPPKLSTLGGKGWKRQKELVGEAVRDLAAEMLRVRAARESMPGIQYPGDTAWQREFEAEFPYEETEDQVTAIAAAKRDMQGQRPMDRLICGDVGFGKTEVAVRAAFKAAEFGRQVAVLVPTTVLAEQHERTFRQRFADYPFRVESISRFKTTSHANAILKDLRAGRVDIMIGTHRLLSKDVRFADLGLVVIDEEQRFGVEHKEQLLKLRLTADVITLSATPIPRTLHMALLGLRDISSLTTPPADRQAVVTEVIPYNERRIERAIRRELAREGQVFYVFNRVHGIKSVADRISKLVPEARVVYGHGQMSSRELEQVMLKFLWRQADVLVSTTIIESGIDIPTANTMIIEDADRFGLADLHQLRGRVGRYKHRAYCYLLLPKTRNVTGVAKKRLRAIEQFSMLGAGFRIAMRDLELRGAGNLLGAEQSGHIAAVGYDMYCRLLDQAVRELKDEETREPSRTSIEIGVVGSIPRVYIPSEARRMEAYRRIATAAGADELERAERDITDAYGDPPEPLRALLDLADLRLGLSKLGVNSVVVRAPDVVFRAEPPDGVAERLEPAKGTVRVLTPEVAGDSVHHVYYRPPAGYLDAVTLLRVLRARLGARAWAQNAALASA